MVHVRVALSDYQFFFFLPFHLLLPLLYFSFHISFADIELSLGTYLTPGINNHYIVTKIQVKPINTPISKYPDL